MTTQRLGRLEKVDLRNFWETEAGDFTPWLAQAENIELLGETIGLELEVEAQEKNVGPFRADILCKDTTTGHWILIENQLERSDHTHLGQLLTYAAGLEVVTIVWITARFTEEHRAALDWLNEITDDRFRFFGLEVELWRIGDSLAAPKFDLVAKPNDWSRSVSAAARRLTESPVSETQALRLAFWTEFSNFLARNGYRLSQRKPSPAHFQNHGIGRTGFTFSALCAASRGWIACVLDLRGDDAKAHYHLLLAQKDEIEREFGAELDWRELPDGKESRIYFINDQMDPNDRDQWPEQHRWLADTLERFDRVFRKRIATLRAEDWNPGDEEADVR